MLITFTSKVYPDVVMFGDIATVFLRAMGQSEEPPGILRGEDIRIAAAKLRAYLDITPKDNPFPEDEGKDRGDAEQRKEQRNRVGLRTRALPLLDIMDASYQKDVDLIWR